MKKSWLTLLTFFLINMTSVVYAHQQINDKDKTDFEELRTKYSIDWFYQKYCSENQDQDECDQDGCRNYIEYFKKTGKNPVCNPIKVEDVDQFTIPQIKSLLLYGNDNIQVIDIIKSLESKIRYDSVLGGKKFTEIRKFIYQEPFLKYNKIGCPIIDSLPKDFPDYREIIIEQIKLQEEAENIIYLKCLNDDNLKKNKQIIVESFNYAPTELFPSSRYELSKNILQISKNDEEIAEIVIKYDNSAMEFLSDALKNNKNFIIKLIDKGYYDSNSQMFFKYVPEKFLDDEDIMLKILPRSYVTNLEKSKKLKGDKKFILKLINKIDKDHVGIILYSISSELRNDLEITNAINQKKGIIKNY